MERFGEKKPMVASRMVCSICQRTIEPDPNGWSGGHNAEPVNDGRCCGDCNQLVVIPARLQRIYEGMSKSKSQSNPQSEEEKH